MAQPASFKLEILEPDGRIEEIAPGLRMSGRARELVFPALDGFAGILPMHAQMLAGVAAGHLYVVEDTDEGARELHFAISGGLLEVAEGGDVTIYADSIEYAGGIDLSRADEAVSRAKARLAGAETSIDIERAKAALARAENRLDVVRKFGRR